MALELGGAGGGGFRAGLALAKDRFFGALVPKAEQYVDERARHVRKQLESGLSLQDGGGANSEREVSGDSDNASPRGSSVSGSFLASNFSGNPNEKESYADEGASRQNGDNSAVASMHAKTLAVLKGELLACQLLEPEVLHFVAEFSGVFHAIFRVYSDAVLPKAFGRCLGGRSHMSLNSFFRFCVDFALFPSRVDFQTIRWLYTTAEGCGDLRLLRKRNEDSLSMLSGKHSRRRRKSSFSQVSSCSAESSQCAGISSPSRPMSPASSRGGPSPRGACQTPEDRPVYFDWQGKRLREHLQWLTKDVAEMPPSERRANAILRAIDDWVSDLTVSLAEIFAFCTSRSTRFITAETFRCAVELMHFEDSPKPADINELAGLVAAPYLVRVAEESLEAVPDIDLGSLQMAISIVRHRKKLSKGKNRFLKDDLPMTRAEVNAHMYCSSLLQVLYDSETSPEAFCRTFDATGSGRTSLQEFTATTADMMRRGGISNTVLSVAEPLEILIVDDKGTVSSQELSSLLHEVSDCIRNRKVCGGKHALFTLGVAPTNQPPRKQNCVFGLQAFVECLLKIALMHLNCHGTASQALQPSFWKVMWLLLYLSEQFELAKQRYGQDVRLRVKLGGVEAVDIADVTGGATGDPRYVPPMKHLVRQSPDLFSHAPHRPPPPTQQLVAAASLLHPATAAQPKRTGSRASSRACVASQPMRGGGRALWRRIRDRDGAVAGGYGRRGRSPAIMESLEESPRGERADDEQVDEQKDDVKQEDVTTKSSQPGKREDVRRCSVCSTVSRSGWGCPACEDCSFADVLLGACCDADLSLAALEAPTASRSWLVDRALFGVGVACSQKELDL
eukprot:TRINITY_DN27456_c0_g1_i1.p1 TRINITY_DN27456_c0_g1~~TRINITY_DN27456_c0_g1_i1.p1  ORF type:complete len:855 (+),score=155.99 TRINITY_DN27456_c0_g1_i1:26-2566(+)